ncbi:MAG: PDZ domain-containing protein [Acidimicrobiales bacterium]
MVGSVAAAGKRTRRWAALPVAVVVGALAFFGATVIHVPYYAISPGSIRTTGDLVELSGAAIDPDPAADPDSSQPDANTDGSARGTISFATVSLDGPVNLLQALSAGLDGTIELAEEDLILQGQTPADNRAANQQLMAGSKDVALRVALTALGLAEPTGAEIELVVAGSPTDAVLSPGDVVLAADDRPVTSALQLARVLGDVKAGQQVSLLVAPVGSRPVDPTQRDLATRDELDAAAVTRQVTVGQSPDQPERPYLGIGVRDSLRITFEGELSIDSSGVGGPSAGLAFTLAVIERLSPGDLTGGERVAATGTIDAFGRVGPIGGIEQKAVAARRAGITVFLVPDSLDPAELARARKQAGSVELVAVGTLTEALAILADRGGDDVALAATSLAAAPGSAPASD